MKEYQFLKNTPKVIELKYNFFWYLFKYTFYYPSTARPVLKIGTTKCKAHAERHTHDNSCDCEGRKSDLVLFQGKFHTRLAYSCTSLLYIKVLFSNQFSCDYSVISYKNIWEIMISNYKISITWNIKYIFWHYISVLC